jgi:hypothetical protein
MTQDSAPTYLPLCLAPTSWIGEQIPIARSGIPSDGLDQRF